MNENKAEFEIIEMALVAYIKLLESKNWSKPQIAKSIGVTPYQVYLYGNGKTRNPRAVICMNIFKGVLIEGKRVLINIYSSYEDLKAHYDIEVGNDSTK